jgi:hypothetical protein
VLHGLATGHWKRVTVMGLDIWFKEDIANILRAANEANLSALAVSEGDDRCVPGPDDRPAELRRAYRQGFAAALSTLWLAFGLPAASSAAEAFIAENAEQSEIFRRLLSRPGVLREPKTRNQPPIIGTDN